MYSARNSDLPHFLIAIWGKCYHVVQTLLTYCRRYISWL